MTTSSVPFRSPFIWFNSNRRKAIVFYLFPILLVFAAICFAAIVLALNSSPSLVGGGLTKIAETGIFISSLIVMAYFLVYTGRHIIFSAVALRSYRRALEENGLEDRNDYPKVSVIIAAHNEGVVIEDAVKTMAGQDYPNFEVVVIDDGSTDDTPMILQRLAHEIPILRYVRRENGGFGKPDALNYGLKYVSGDIVLTFDADYVPMSPDVLKRLSRWFSRDPSCWAVQGFLVPYNTGNGSVIAKSVFCERVGGYIVNQLARQQLGLLPQYGGTVGGFRREVIQRLGWNGNALTEDTDLTVRIAINGGKVIYDVTARSWEQAVQNLRSYWRQRYRWARGHMQCALRYFADIMRSKTMGFAQKLDAVLLLGIYFVGVMTALGWLLSFAWWAYGLSWSSIFSAAYFPILAFWTFGALGNTAPFHELIVGLKLYGNGVMKMSKYVLLLAPLFLLNTAICCEALVHELVGHRSRWEKTERYLGVLHNNGNSHNSRNQGHT